MELRIINYKMIDKFKWNKSYENTFTNNQDFIYEKPAILI